MTVFTRDVTIGGNQFTEEIQKQLNVSYEEAEALKIGGGRSDADAVVPQEVERVMAAVAEQVAGEIQRSLDFYAGTAADANVLQGLPLGRHGEDPRAVQDHRGARGRAGGDREPVQERSMIDSRRFDPAFIMDVAPMAAVAVGLALRRPGDKLVLRRMTAMMIRINLLPVRQVKKREIGRQFLVVVGRGAVHHPARQLALVRRAASEEKKHAQRMAATQARIAELEKVIGEVDNINARKKEVQDKLAILADLRKQRTGPVRMLDALATATPKKVWLTDFEEKSSAVKMTGRAVSHEDVAEFMRGLQTAWSGLPRGWGGSSSRSATPGTARVELVGGEGAVEDFPTKSISNFFTRVDLKKAESKAAHSGSAAARHASWSSRST